MKPHIKETSAGIILYREPLEILVIQHKSTKRWYFPKGHQEHNETLEQTAIREIGEEVGARSINVHPNFHHQLTYTHEFSKEISTKTIHFFLAQWNGQVKLEDEISDFKWMSPREAKKLMEYEQRKEVCQKVIEFFEKND